MPASGWRPYSLLKRCQVLRVRVCTTCPRTTGWPDSLALHQFVLFVKFRPLKHFTRQSARASNQTRGNPVFLVLTWNKKKSYLTQVLSLNIDHGRLTSHLFHYKSSATREIRYRRQEEMPHANLYCPNTHGAHARGFTRAKNHAAKRPPKKRDKVKFFFVFFPPPRSSPR